MARVLLVENDSVWLDLLRRALPEYDVDGAQTYEDALALLSGDDYYDVAIVDINLLPRGRDKLGGRLLEYMRDKRPAVRRIALTGQAPTAVRAILDRYDPDDLLLKNNIDLSVMREVVEAALNRAASEVPGKFRDARMDLRNSLRLWKEPVALQLAQRARTLLKDIRDAEYLGRKADDSARVLAELESKQQTLGDEAAKLAGMVASIRSDEDIAQAYQLLSELQAKYSD